MLNVHVRINDATTASPIPVRLRLVDSQGKSRLPLGWPVAGPTSVGGPFQLGTGLFCPVEGACEVQLPPGTLIAELSRGPEYSAVVREVVLAPGQMALRLGIERWTDWRKQGWYAGDMRCHDLTPHAALLEAGAEDLACVQLLARGNSSRVTNLEAFSGSRVCLAGDHAQVAVNTLNSHPVLGTVALLHCHRPVFPLHSGEPGEAFPWSVADWCDQCHRKTGLVVWPDLPRLEADRLEGEALAAALLGKIDCFEIASFLEAEPATLAHYYRLLDVGCRLHLVGASGKESSTTVLGAVRTYARLAPETEFSLAAWMEAVRAGRTFVTNGPLVAFEVAGQQPGQVLTVLPGQRLSLRVEVQSQVPFDQVEILAGGVVLATKSASGNRQATVLEVEYEATHSTWLAARCHGGERLPTGSLVFAHTSAVHLEMAGRPIEIRDETSEPFLDILARTADWIATVPACDPPRQREHLLGVIAEARGRLLGQ